MTARCGTNPQVNAVPAHPYAANGGSDGVPFGYPAFVAPASTTELRRLLARSLLFEGLSEADLDRIVAISHRRRLGPGELLFHKGDPADRVFAVLRGSVRVVRSSSEGREVTLRILDAGQVFGELGVFHRGARTATIVAAEESELLAVGRGPFLALLERHPPMGVQLLAAMAARIDVLSSELADLVFRNLPARLAKKVLELGRIYGERDSAGLRIRTRVSQQDLANLVGVSRESVNKQLRSWEDEGLVSLRRFTLTLHDPEVLARIADAVAESDVRGGAGAEERPATGGGRGPRVREVRKPVQRRRISSPRT